MTRKVFYLGQIDNAANDPEVGAALRARRDAGAGGS